MPPCQSSPVSESRCSPKSFYFYDNDLVYITHIRLGFNTILHIDVCSYQKNYGCNISLSLEYPRSINIIIRTYLYRIGLHIAGLISEKLCKAMYFLSPSSHYTGLPLLALKRAHHFVSSHNISEVYLQLLRMHVFILVVCEWLLMNGY